MVNCILSIALNFYEDIQMTLTTPKLKEFLISYGKPHKQVTLETVSSWIKDGLSPAGANVIVYKGHISRYPSFSKARDMGYHLFMT